MTIADHPPRLRVLVAGIGKMGLSHLSMLRAHPQVDVVGVCDSTTYVLDVLGKYTGLPTFTDYDAMIGSVPADAVLIATPTRKHFDMATSALSAGLHVFCEKPLCLSPQQSESLVAQAASRGLVGQVGYHYRFVGCLPGGQAPARRRRDRGGHPRTGRGVRPGGAAPEGLHLAQPARRGRRLPVRLRRASDQPGELVLRCAHAVGGTVLNSVFSRETEDEVYGTLYFPGGVSAQLSVNWSDESYRKMSTKLTIWGTERPDLC